MSQVLSPSTICPNCSAALSGPYCGTCGQKAGPVNPTFHDLVHDLVHEFLHVDGKIFRSVALLFARPGFLTRELFLGRRTRYISPIRLYLVFSVLFFAASSLAPRAPVLTDADRAEAGASGVINGALARLSPEQISERIREAQHTWVPRLMFVLVPLCALLVQAVTRRTARNYPQHLYFALHGHAAFFGGETALALAEPLRSPALNATLQAAFYAAVPIYLTMAFRTAYGGSVRLAIGRAAFVVIVYGAIVLLAIAGLFAAVLLR